MDRSKRNEVASSTENNGVARSAVFSGSNEDDGSVNHVPSVMQDDSSTNNASLGESLMQDDSSRNNASLGETLLTPGYKSSVRQDENFISPLVIVPAAKGRGRPKLEKRAGKPWLKKPTSKLIDDDLPKQGKKRKAKSDDGPKSKKPTQEIADALNGKKRRGRPPKKLANETCNLCGFRFDDPVKREKKKISCHKCQSAIHEACFKRDRVENDLEGCNDCTPL